MLFTFLNSRLVELEVPHSQNFIFDNTPLIIFACICSFGRNICENIHLFIPFVYKNLIFGIAYFRKFIIFLCLNFKIYVQKSYVMFDIIKTFLRDKYVSPFFTTFTIRAIILINFHKLTKVIFK